MLFFNVGGDDFYCDKHFVQDAINILEKESIIDGCAFNFQFLYPDKIITPDNLLEMGLLILTSTSKMYIYIQDALFLEI